MVFMASMIESVNMQVTQPQAAAKVVVTAQRAAVLAESHAVHETPSYLKTP